MIKNIFFKQKGPFLLKELFDNIDHKKRTKIYDVKSLNDASNLDTSFLESANYIESAKFTKAEEMPYESLKVKLFSLTK